MQIQTKQSTKTLSSQKSTQISHISSSIIKDKSKLSYSFIKENKHDEPNKLAKQLLKISDERLKKVGNMNKSQIIATNSFRTTNRSLLCKTSRLKENIKMFDPDHVPTIFKKIKRQMIQTHHEQICQPFNSNNIFPSAERLNIKSHFSKQLSTTYEEQDQYRTSQKLIQYRGPQIVIVKKKTLPLNRSTDIKFLQNLPKLNDFDIGQLLGKGAFGTVRVVRHKLTGFFFALKTYSMKGIMQKLDRFIQTVKLQMFTRHPNVAQLYSIFRQDDKFYLLMQLCIDGDLSGSVKYLKNKKQKTKQIIKGIVCGLTYLHQKQIIHRDIKLQNILLSYDMPKITDFDLAIYQKNPLESRRTFCGSPAYFSPQMLSKYQYNNKVDIWSLGILSYEVICGYYPFQISINDLMNIVNEKHKQLPPDLSEDVQNFIKIMLVKNPEDRANWTHIIHHPYLNN